MSSISSEEGQGDGEEEAAQGKPPGREMRGTAGSGSCRGSLGVVMGMEPAGAG